MLSGLIKRVFNWLTGIAILCSLSTQAQYNVGVYVVDTIYIGSYSSIAFCAPNPDVNIAIDSNLFSNVTGLNYRIILTDVNGVGIGTPLYPNFQTGDTLPLAPGIQYPVFFPAGGSIQFIIQAFGTPLINNEVYYCDVGYLFTLGFCNNLNLFYADTTGAVCMVGSVGKSDLITEDLLLYPNPASAMINIVGDCLNCRFKISNMMGVTVSEGILSSMPYQIDVSNLVQGLYAFSIFKNRDIVTKLLCIESYE